jgi:Uma2 family endonuclease
LPDGGGVATYGKMKLTEPAVSTAVLIPIADYLSSSYRPDREYVDGELVERNMGEFDHARLQMLLSRYLSNRERDWGILVLPEQRVQVTPTRFRVPDITVLTARPDTQILHEPPFLCIELLSPGDRMAEMQDRIDDYLAFGVRYVWLINPKSLRAWVYTKDAVQEAKGGLLETQDPNIQVALAELE